MEQIVVVDIVVEYMVMVRNLHDVDVVELMLYSLYVDLNED